MVHSPRQRTHPQYIQRRHPLRFRQLIHPAPLRPNLALLRRCLIRQGRTLERLE